MFRFTLSYIRYPLIALSTVAFGTSLNWVDCLPCCAPASDMVRAPRRIA
jgi:hypothetical protein